MKKVDNKNDNYALMVDMVSIYVGIHGRLFRFDGNHEEFYDRLVDHIAKDSECLKRLKNEIEHKRETHYSINLSGWWGSITIDERNRQVAELYACDKKALEVIKNKSG